MLCRVVVVMEILMFILGSIMGSFFLCLGTRLPLKENFINARSKCDYCHENLRWYELIPIFSYLIQKGKCRHCHHDLSITYLLMELITGFLFLGGYLYFGFTIKLAIYLVLVSVTLIIFVSDFKYMVILDSPLIIGSIMLIVLKYLEGGWQYTFVALIYGVVAFSVMYLIKLLGDKIYHRESLGGGDIKLAFLIGLTLGYPYIGLRMSLVCLIFASFLALPYALANLYLKKKNELPYGPFLASSLLIIFIFLEKFQNLLIFFNLT